MDIFEIVSHIEQTGYCVVENVIPVNEVDAICNEIITVQQAYHQQAAGVRERKSLAQTFTKLSKTKHFN